MTLKRKQTTGCTAVLLILCGMAACGDPPPSKYPAKETIVEDTTLSAGDLFMIRVYRQDELSGEYSVSSEGTISFPLIGTVEVGGKTPAQVERLIRESLANGYLKDPQVSVLVKEYRSKKISVFGQVRKPGTLPFVDGMTVVEAISKAGGFTEMARKNAVTVTRKAGSDAKKFTVPVESIGEGKAASFFMRPGDTIFVPRRLW